MGLRGEDNAVAISGIEFKILDRPVYRPASVPIELRRLPNRACIMILLRVYEGERNTFGQWKRPLVSYHVAGKTASKLVGQK